LVNFADLNRSVESSAHTIDKKTEDSSEQQSSLTSADENEELLKSKRLHLIEWLRSSVHHLQGFQLWKALIIVMTHGLDILTSICWQL
jgi:transposase